MVTETKLIFETETSLFSSLDQQTTKVRAGATLPEENAGADGRQPIHCLPHWPKTW